MRYLGIRHRIKSTADGKVRPTQVVILTGDMQEISIDLVDEDAEMDFLTGRYPTKFRDVETGENFSGVAPHHIHYRDVRIDDDVSFWTPELVKYRKLKKKESEGDFPPANIRVIGKVIEVAAEIPGQIPAAYEGLQTGDVVAMMLGGSAYYLAYALTARGESIGAKVLRISPSKAAELREGSSKDKDKDASFLAALARSKPELFHLTLPADRAQILVEVALAARNAATKARIASQQNLQRLHRDRKFCSPTGFFPEGSVKKDYEATMASDVGYQTFVGEEAKRVRELTKVLEALPIYKKVFKPIVGVGPLISAPIIAAVKESGVFPATESCRRFAAYMYGPTGAFPVGATTKWLTGTTSAGKPFTTLATSSTNGRDPFGASGCWRIRPCTTRCTRPLLR